jgi:hypothetical protein
MGDSAHTTHHTNQNQKSAPALFLEYENIFQKRPPWWNSMVGIATENVT